MSTPKIVALVGSPNSGKTTLFNWLTGSKFKTVNYAGSTVEAHRGQTLSVYGDSVTVIDTPGIYSLEPSGRDEEVTLNTLVGSSEVRAVILVIDGTQLNRQLYLVRQLQELGLPMVLAVTMVDLAGQAGRRLDLVKLSELTKSAVVEIDNRLGGGVRELVDVTKSLFAVQSPRKVRGLDWDEPRIEREIQVVEGWARQVVHKTPDRETLDHLRRWDRVLLHPWWGVLAFVVIMAALFSSIFWVAAPAMDLIDTGFAWAVESLYIRLGETAFAGFLANGVIGGVGAVLVFVPQIFILFFGFTLLEDSGYLARAATVVDRPLHWLGLSGRAFVPILSGFACAVPAIMAARNIRSSRERWITVFIIPFMTCSARLPVYALLLTFLFHDSPAWMAGLALTGLYVGGLFIGAVAAKVLNLILRKTPDSHFLMELPIYRWPKFGLTLRMALRRTLSYVRKAGPTIFVFVLILWMGSHYPQRPGASPAEQLQESVVGQIGQAIEPVFAPMGLDWRAGLGIISAFVAREVFVSSLAVIYSLSGNDEEKMQQSLLSRMREANFKPATIIGLIVFFMIALQCLSTTGVTWREMGSWKFAVGQLLAMNLLAYVAAVGVFQWLN